jgi:hypothetical protein
VLHWLNGVVAMLAEIFMLRIEAAARLQEQSFASLPCRSTVIVSSSVKLTPGWR